jgi:hypothetical protein
LYTVALAQGLDQVPTSVTLVTLILTVDLLFNVNWKKTCFFVPRIPHNTCRRSGVHFSEVTLILTVDLFFKVNWKTCFFVPRIPDSRRGANQYGFAVFGTEFSLQIRRTVRYKFVREIPRIREILRIPEYIKIKPL